MFWCGPPELNLIISIYSLLLSLIIYVFINATAMCPINKLLWSTRSQKAFNVVKHRYTIIVSKKKKKIQGIKLF